MEFFSQHVFPYLPHIVGSLLAILLAWGVRKLNLAAELEKAIVDLTQRCVDKAKDWAGIAMSPTSDGGVKITEAELSKLRQLIWDTAKEELTGPVGKLLLAWGEERVKGLAGGLLHKIGVTATEGSPQS